MGRLQRVGGFNVQAIENICSSNCIISLEYIGVTKKLLKPPLTAVSNNDSEPGYIERNPSLNQGNLVLFLDSYHWPRMFSLKHRLFLSQQLTKHQRIHEKKKTHTPKTKNKKNNPQFFLAFTHNFYFSSFQKPKRIKHRVEKSLRSSHPPTIDFVVGSLQIHLHFEESNHKLPAMCRSHWYHSWFEETLAIFSWKWNCPRVFWLSCKLQKGKWH